MAYSDFTFPLVPSRFGLTMSEPPALFVDVPEAELPPEWRTRSLGT